MGLGWSVFEACQERLQRWANSKQIWTSFVSGAAAGALSSVLLRPLGVIISRKQTEELEMSYARIARRIWESEGPGALYKGLGARLMASTPRFGMFYSSYSIFATWAMEGGK